VYAHVYIFECITSHIWTNHVTHLSHHVPSSIGSYTYKSTSHSWRAHVYIFEFITSHIWMNHVTHLCHHPSSVHAYTYESTPHLWRAHVYIFELITSHICDVPMSQSAFTHIYMICSYWEVGGWGRVPFSRNLMSPTPRRKWYLTTGRRAH